CIRPYAEHWQTLPIHPFASNFAFFQEGKTGIVRTGKLRICRMGTTDANPHQSAALFLASGITRAFTGREHGTRPTRASTAFFHTDGKAARREASHPASRPHLRLQLDG